MSAACSSVSSSDSTATSNASRSVGDIPIPSTDDELLDFGYAARERVDYRTPEQLYLYDHRFECGREVIHRYGSELHPSKRYGRGDRNVSRYVNFIGLMVQVGRDKFAALTEEQKREYIKDANQAERAYRQRVEKNRKPTGEQRERLIQQRQTQQRSQGQHSISIHQQGVELHHQFVNRAKMFWDQILGEYSRYRILAQSTASAPYQPIPSTQNTTTTISSSSSSSYVPTSEIRDTSTGNSSSGDSSVMVRGPFHVFQTSYGNGGGLSILDFANESDFRRAFDKFVLEMEQEDQTDPSSFRSELIEVNQGIPLDELIKLMVQYGHKQVFVQFTRGWMAVVEGGAVRGIAR